MGEFVFFVEIAPNDYKAIKCSKYEKGITVGDLLDTVSENLKIPREKLKVFSQYKIRERRKIDESVEIEDLVKMHYLVNVSAY